MSNNKEFLRLTCHPEFYILFKRQSEVSALWVDVKREQILFIQQQMLFLDMLLHITAVSATLRQSSGVSDIFYSWKVDGKFLNFSYKRF